MKNYAARNGGLALVGLAALTIYILACTSFSPDDKKVVYPAFDPQTGVAGVAVYDRETSRSRMVFVPITYSDTNVVSKPLLRPQWLGNGRRLLVSWTQESGSSGLNLAVVPLNNESAVRLFNFSLSGEGQSLMMPVPVVGQYAFLPGSNAVLRLNLSNGSVLRHDIPEGNEDFWVYPGFGDESVFFVFKDKEKESCIFGQLDPNTFARTPTLSFTNQPADGSFIAYNERGNRLALVENVGDGHQLVVLEPGKRAFIKQISATEQLKYGNGLLLSRKNQVLASYMRRNDKTSTFGLLEIPLNAEPVRDTVLIRDVQITDQEAALYFQVGVSHDGKTAAVSSMYVACEAKELKPDQCALFFVDLSSSKRKVTKIPIAMPHADAAL